MKKKIGIIGSTGRMGRIVKEQISAHNNFENGLNFNDENSLEITLEEVFGSNDYIIDFSSPQIIGSILEIVFSTPRPLVIGTTGWSGQQVRDLLIKASAKAPIVIASNTSYGMAIQRYMVRQLARLLDSNYDIDITEKHHRHKIDIPSGTANTLLKDIQDTKQNYHELNYEAYVLKNGPRPPNFIGINIQRSGNINGDHEVSFISPDEMISIKHVAFNRSLFAKGALNIVNWLDQTKPQPGLYSINDILKLPSL